MTNKFKLVYDINNQIKQLSLVGNDSKDGGTIIDFLNYELKNLDNLVDVGGYNVILLSSKILGPVILSGLSHTLINNETKSITLINNTSYDIIIANKYNKIDVKYQFDIGDNITLTPNKICQFVYNGSKWVTLTSISSGATKINIVSETINEIKESEYDDATKTITVYIESGLPIPEDTGALSVIVNSEDNTIKNNKESIYDNDNRTITLDLSVDNLPIPEDTGALSVIVNSEDNTIKNNKESIYDNDNRTITLDLSVDNLPIPEDTGALDINIESEDNSIVQYKQSHYDKDNRTLTLYIKTTGSGKNDIAVTTMDPTDILSKSAILHGFITSLGDEIEPVSVYFEYYQSDNPTDIKKTEIIKLFNLIDFSSKIYGLTPTKKYKYRAVIKGTSGTSFGQFIEFESAGYLPQLCVTKKYIGTVDDFENTAISYKNLLVSPTDTIKINEDKGVVISNTNNGKVYSLTIEDKTPEVERFIKGCGEFNMIIPRIDIDKPTNLTTLTLSSDNSNEIYEGKELIISDNFDSYYRTVNKFTTFSSVGKFEKEYFVDSSNTSIDSVAAYSKTGIRAMILNNHKIVGNGKIIYSIDGGQWRENPTDLSQTQFRKIVATNKSRFYAIADTDGLVMDKRNSLICIPNIDESPQGVNYYAGDTNGITALAFGQGTAVASRENGKLMYERDSNQREWIDFNKDTRLTNIITAIKSNSINYEIYPLWVIADALGNVSYMKSHITSGTNFTSASNNSILYNSTHARDIGLIKGNSTNAVFVCKNGKIFYTSNSFASIDLSTINVTLPTENMHFNAVEWCELNKSFIAVGNNGVVLESFDMGKTWDKMEVDGLGTYDVLSLTIVDDIIMMGAANGNLYTRKLNNFFTIDFTDNPLREIPVHVANGGQRFLISISDINLSDFKEAKIISTTRLGNLFNFKTDFVENVGYKARLNILMTDNNTLTSMKLDLYENRLIE